MNWPILVLVGSQLLFTLSDVLARIYMPKHGFGLATFLSGWFVAYFMIRNIAMFGQLYVFTTMELGKTSAFFGAVSIILANVIGLLVLQEVLPLGVYIGVVFALIAFLVLALS